MKREYAIDKLIENADKCVNMLDLCHRMGIESVGGEDYREVRNLAKELGVELVFSFKQNKPSMKSVKLPNEMVFVKNGHTSTTNLKKKIIREGLKEYKCEKCGITEWQGEPISLQIHHINGDHHDNRLENLQFLCPNCHSQTDTYAGKNSSRGSSTKPRKLTDEDYKKIIEENWIKTHPSVEEFISSFVELGTFVGVAKKYGVSDNALKKWCKHYNIPDSKKELMEYINRGIGNG